MKKQNDYHDYYYYLKDEINKFHGPVKEYIYYLPALFRALTGILNAETHCRAETHGHAETHDYASLRGKGQEQDVVRPGLS